MSRERRKLHRKQKRALTQAVDKQNFYPNPTVPEITETRRSVELINLGPGVRIRPSKIEGLKTKQGVEDRDLYSLDLLSSRRNLSFLLDLGGRQKIITIGKKDYIIKEDRLIETEEPGFWDIFYKAVPGGEQVQLEKGENNEIIIDIRKLRENDRVKEFLEK